MIPEADQSEKYVLATIMQNEEAYWDVVEQIPEVRMFRLDFHQQMYETMQQIINDGGTPDLPTLGTQFQPTTLLEYEDMFTSIGNVDYHCQQVKNAYVRRQLMQMLAETQERLEIEPDGVEVMHDLLNDFYELDTSATTEVVSFAEMIEAGAEYYMTRKEQGVVGHRTGFRELDNLTMGIENHDYWVILGAPSQGKTAMAMQMALNLAENGITVGVLPLEGSIAKLGYRFLLNKHSVRPEDYTGGLTQTMERIHELPIHTRKIGQLTDVTYPAAVQQMKRQYDVDVVIVDYIQLMFGHGENRTQQLGNISRAIVDTNNRLDIASIVLSQPVKDAFEGRLPTMSDVRESGAIAQDATKILGIAAATNLKSHKLLDNLEPDEIQEKTILNLCKNKEGQTKALRIHVKPELMKLYDEDYRD